MDLLEKALAMLSSAVAIANFICLSAISYNLLHHYLTSSKSHTHKPQSQRKNKNKAGCTEPEAMMSNSNGVDVLDNDYSLFKLLQESHNYEREAVLVGEGHMSNFNAFDSLGWSIPILANVMEALGDPNTHLIRVYGLNDEIKDGLLQKVYRRVQRDETFGMVMTISITKYPDLRKIQENIASQLGLNFNHMRKDKRAIDLVHKINNELEYSYCTL